MWISVKERLPEPLETVWLTNGKAVWLGCLYDDGDAWCWAVSNGVIDVENFRIVSECELDDIEVTHWHALPDLKGLVNTAGK